jgi:hypothetical protein
MAACARVLFVHTMTLLSLDADASSFESGLHENAHIIIIITYAHGTHLKASARTQSRCAG